MAYRVYDELESYTKQADGSFIVETIYPVGEWLFPYIAYFGCHCEVIEPLDVRNHIKVELQKIISNYL